MSFSVRYSAGALADFDRLFDFLLERATTSEDLDLAQRALDEIRGAVDGVLPRMPFSFRKASTSPTQRELVIPLGASGYVALYEIDSPSLIVILAVRHRLEADYH